MVHHLILVSMITVSSKCAEMLIESFHILVHLIDFDPFALFFGWMWNIFHLIMDAYSGLCRNSYHLAERCIG